MSQHQIWQSVRNIKQQLAGKMVIQAVNPRFPILFEYEFSENLEKEN